jgi:hypothetical protein
LSDLRTSKSRSTHRQVARVDKKGKFPDGKWFDSKRVTLVGDQRAMAAPKFESVRASCAPKASP